MKRNILRKVIRGCEYCFTMLNLLNKYSKESPDIIHIQWLLFYQFDYFWLRILRYLLRRKNTKIILTAHNILPHINGYKYKNILEKIYSNFDDIIVHSKVLKTQMIEVFDAKANDWSICVIPHGANYKVLEKVNKDILNDYIKKIRAFKAERYNFLFAGTIILKNVIFLGKINKYEVADLYKKVIACLVLFKNLPILTTNSPNKFFDAISSGKPIITNMNEWIGELIETHNIGFSVDPNNSQALVEAIVKLLHMSKNKIKKMGQKACDLAMEKFNSDNMTDKLEMIFKEATKSSSK